MHDHMPQHGRTASQHDRQQRPLWRACVLQTYFTAKRQIDYFVVEGGDSTVDDQARADAGTCMGYGMMRFAPLTRRAEID
jgi:hypothetical protein